MPVNALLLALVAELRAEDVPDPLNQRFTLAALWADHGTPRRGGRAAGDRPGPRRAGAPRAVGAGAARLVRRPPLAVPRAVRDPAQRPDDRRDHGALPAPDAPLRRTVPPRPTPRRARWGEERPAGGCRRGMESAR